MKEFKTKLFSRIYQLDPTYEFLFKAFQITVSSTIGSVLWFIYFGQPQSFLLILSPTFIVMVSFFYSTWKEKILNMLYATVLITVFQLGSSVLHHDKLVFLVFIFFISVIFYLDNRFKNAACVAMPIAIVTIALPGDLAIGINRSFQLLISYFISVSVVTTFSIISAKFRMRSALVYMSDLLINAFMAYFSGEKHRIRKLSQAGSVYDIYAYINKVVLSRSDLSLERIFESENEVLQHRISSAQFNAQKIIDLEEYHIERNKKFSKLSSYILSCQRKIYRCFDFIIPLEKYRDEVYEIFPDIDCLADEIFDSFLNIHNALKGKTNIFYYNRENIKDWYGELKLIDKEYRTDESRKDSLEIIYGFISILKELDHVERILSSKAAVVQL